MNNRAIEEIEVIMSSSTFSSFICFQLTIIIILKIVINWKQKKKKKKWEEERCDAVWWWGEGNQWKKTFTLYSLIFHKDIWSIQICSNNNGYKTNQTKISSTSNV